jgi:hypothetical protein
LKPNLLNPDVPGSFQCKINLPESPDLQVLRAVADRALQEWRVRTIHKLFHAYFHFHQFKMGIQ